MLEPQAYGSYRSDGIDMGSSEWAVYASVSTAMDSPCREGAKSTGRTPL